MRNMLLIAKREYLERVRTKAFMVVTLLIPALMVGGVYFMYLKVRNGHTADHIAITSQSASLALDLQQELKSDKDNDMTIDVMDWSAQQRLMQEVDQKKLDGFLSIDTGLKDIHYYSGAAADLVTKQRLSSALRTVLLRKSLTHYGADKAAIDELLKAPVIQSDVVHNGHASKSSEYSGYITAYVLFFLMYFAVMLHGMNVARSVIEEKTSRVFEVMLATVKPSDMMAGKLIGVGSVGITQLGIWVATILALAFSPLVAAMSTGYKPSISIEQIVFFIVFFILGFLLYSGIAAALGAICNSEQELQQFNMIIAMPMAACSIMLFPVATAPNSVFSKVISQIPLFSPLMMYVRISTQMPDWWEIALSIGILLVTVYGIIWFSARIYRVGILMYGKRPTLPEILRWLRYS